MLLSQQEERELEGELWTSAERWEAAFGHDSHMARLFRRVVHALERGEAVQRRGGWVREGDGRYKAP